MKVIVATVIEDNEYCCYYYSGKDCDPTRGQEKREGCGMKRERRGKRRKGWS